MPTALYVDSPLDRNELCYKNINYEKMFPALFLPFTWISAHPICVLEDRENKKNRKKLS